MSTDQPLTQRRCAPCEGGVPPLDSSSVEQMLRRVDQWQLCDDGKAITKKWTFKDFVQALAFVNRVGEVAEEEQHHPDLHLVGYRNVRVELTTHAIGGLSDNDFILAAKIDALKDSA